MQSTSGLNQLSSQRFFFQNKLRKKLRGKWQFQADAKNDRMVGKTELVVASFPSIIPG